MHYLLQQTFNLYTFVQYFIAIIDIDIVRAQDLFVHKIMTKRVMDENKIKKLKQLKQVNYISH